MTELKYIIGGSASSGSSFLVNMLGRHSEIYAGPETNILTHPEWMMNWANREKHTSGVFFDRKLSQAWHVHRGIQYDHLIKREELISHFASASSFDEFISHCFGPICSVNTASIYAEKTPSNAAYFHLHDELFPSAHKILTIRNPLDAIASMVRRGWSIPYAVGLYLFNISIGYHSDFKRTIIRYEDLIDGPEDVTSSILALENLIFEKDMLSDENQQTISSWVQYKDGQSTRTFDMIKPIQKQMILHLIYNMKFKEDFQFYGKTPSFSSIIEICDLFDYNVDVAYPKKWELNIRAQALFLLEKWKRRLRSYPLSGENFPLELKS